MLKLVFNVVQLASYSDTNHAIKVWAVNTFLLLWINMQSSQHCNLYFFL